MEPKQSFSTSDVAKYCHVTPDTIRKWAEAGKLHVFKTPGGHRRVRRDDLIQFLKENKIPLHEDLKHSATKVLIVDDEKIVISVIRRFLGQLETPFHVEIATDGFEAGSLVTLFKPDVVFLDLRLPGIDGFEVCRRIKSNPYLQSPHVSAMTGYYEGETAERVLELGATLLIQKPFTPEDLTAALERVGVTIE
jgi:excisionase family DNA binding protein